jgi:hypothetical protein
MQLWIIVSWAACSKMVQYINATTTIVAWHKALTAFPSSSRFQMDETASESQLSKMPHDGITYGVPHLSRAFGCVRFAFEYRMQRSCLVLAVVVATNSRSS